MLETDQILVIGQVTGNMGVLESDVGIFPSHAADGPWECSETSLSCKLHIYKPGVVLITLVGRAGVGTRQSIHLKCNSQVDCKLYEGRKQLYLVPAVFIASSPPPDTYFAQ